jgi:hypothetical protein
MWLFRSINMFVHCVIPFQSLRNGLQLLILVSCTVCLSFCLFAFLSFSIFEIKENIVMHLPKKDLIPMLNANVVVPFHKVYVHSVIPFQSLGSGLQLLILVSFTVCLSFCLFPFCLSVFSPFCLSLLLRSKRT